MTTKLNVNITTPVINNGNYSSEMMQDNSQTNEKTKTFASNATIKHSRVHIVGKGNSYAGQHPAKRAVAISQVPKL